MWSMGLASEFLSGLTEAGALDIGFEAAGSEGGVEGLEDLGELILIAGAILLTAHAFKTIGKFWRERRFRRYQEEFKCQQTLITLPSLLLSKDMYNTARCCRNLRMTSSIYFEMLAFMTKAVALTWLVSICT
jgi:hypothetical protein